MAAAGAVLAGCTSTVQIPKPSPPAEVVQVCRDLHAKLPKTLGGGRRRPTKPESMLLAAWGDPPVALRCGVGRPSGLRPTSRLVTVNGVDWFPAPPDAPTRFTTIGRTAYVQVIMPEEEKGDGAQPAAVLVELAAPIKSAVPKT